CQQSKSNPYTF
nr:immunoglobulin light chain junction region [Macaca mulatta]MOV74502.1 immunoglobulin light chain junction region [Macaca mulatta]MOV74608.1 immunoglobulin light chain junction region [Macaca mulatta]MOV74659.1 immunoglobulin light chain junction region [Macaca mulatta]MOV74719.1 immunoglobulin light chain junction region [Macaca mulatta]